MGQTASKVVTQWRQGVSKATNNGRNTAIPSNSGTTTPHSSHTTPTISSTMQHPPSSGGDTNWSHLSPKDAQQHLYLQRNKGEYKDMSAELQNFIQDVGPLQKKPIPTKASTSASDKGKPTVVKSRAPRMPRELRTNDRTVSNMPLAKNVPGFETSRSTSFSYQVADPDIHEWTRGDILDMYHFLQSKRANDKITVEHVETTSNKDLELTKLADRLFEEYATNEQKEQWSATQTEHHKTILRQTLQYVDVPILMQDTEDDSWVGVHPRDREELQERHKLVSVSADKAKLVLQDLVERKQKSST